MEDSKHQEFVVLTGFCIGGGRDVQPGEKLVLPVSAETAGWVYAGRIRPAPAPAPRPDPEAVQSQDATPSHREPAPARRASARRGRK